MIGKGAQLSLSLGQLGSTFINTTAVFTGQWGAITCITDCAFTTLTSGNRPTTPATVLMIGTLASITLKGGMTIYGYFTAITLASGSVIAYEV